MCAIFGWIKFKTPLTESDITNSQTALKSMKHRGPDASGEWIKDNIFLGHNRLSIIDLSAEANQPFWDDAKRYSIIFNGEIYNYLELRESLQKEGVSFRTKSDTEVVLKAFIHYGPKAFLKYDGMFAFAIHDLHLKKTYIVRDFLGQKPLYYFPYDGGLIFASELKALLKINSFTWRLNKHSFYKYLMNTCYMDPTTPIEDIHKVPAGSYLEVTGQEVLTHQYWDSIPGENTLDLTWEEAFDTLGNLLDNSCKISMRSDVPYGVFLSGGIDSTLIMDSCMKINPNTSAYIVSMGEKDFDESPKAISVMDRLGVKDKRIYRIDTDSIPGCIDEHFAALDEPHGDPGYVSSFFLAKACRKEITVGLTGDGADELLAGYIPFLALSKTAFFEHCPTPFLSLFKGLTSLLPSSDKYMGFKFLASYFLKGFPSHKTTRVPLWLSSTSPEELSHLCPHEEKAFFSRFGESGTLYEDFRRRLEIIGDQSAVNLTLYYYQKFFLPSYVYMHTDRAGMWHSLELRSPFLSVPLVEFCNRLPKKFKISKGQLKVLLRKYVEHRGFSSQIYRQKKQGFSIPISRWLKTALKDHLLTALGKDRRFNALIDRPYLNRLIDEHFANKRNNYPILFNLVVFSEWLERNPMVKI